ncbi:MAG TPA: hypothetical protein G4N96_14235 [Chloroflexi bacterium]|nr:MAG: hypothetical protein B6243_02645 [Anaerolineaceae bacterium 4572_5.2]HEY86260.1 hypothetical protein [Chloroflexota bacterium]
MSELANGEWANLTKKGILYSLAPNFQEYNVEQLDLAQHQELVIERTLAYGNRAEVRWLFDVYDATQIKEWVMRQGNRRLPWRRYNMWCVLLKLPPARRYRSEEQRIWPF